MVWYFWMAIRRFIGTITQRKWDCRCSTTALDHTVGDYSGFPSPKITQAGNVGSFLQCAPSPGGTSLPLMNGPGTAPFRQQTAWAAPLTVPHLFVWLFHYRVLHQLLHILQEEKNRGGFTNFTNSWQLAANWLMAENMYVYNEPPTLWSRASFGSRCHGYIRYCRSNSAAMASCAVFITHYDMFPFKKTLEALN